MEDNVVETIKKKNVIMGVMACIIILLIGELVYFVFVKKEDKPVDNNGENNQQVIDNTDKPTENDNLKPWMEYILQQNITKIEVSKVPCSEDNFDTKTATLSVDQLRNVFKKFMNYKLRVSYSGGGGWECGETLIIKYLKDGKEYELEYLGNEGHVVPSSDGCATIYDKDLENALYNSSDIKDEEFKNQEGICVMYDMLAPDNYLFDEYFK